MAGTLAFLLLFLVSSCINAFSFSDRLPYKGTLTQRTEFRAFLDSKMLEAQSRVEPRAPTTSFDQAINKHANTPTDTIAAARDLVEASIRKAAAHNKARVENPLRNTYLSRHSASRKRENTTDYPLMLVDSTLASAAALVAEVDAAVQAKNGTLFGDYSKVDALWTKTKGKARKRATSSFWLAQKKNLGTWPYGGDSSYQVFRNVKDYGATGNGVTDDTLAINAAITAGNRCGASCESSSVNGAVIYFPAGTYLVSGSIISYYNTQLVGDPTCQMSKHS